MLTNEVKLIGHLGSVPAWLQKEGKSGFATLRIATNLYFEINGKVINRTDWHTVICFDDLAKFVRENLTKGSKIEISGYLSYSKYTDKKGIERFSTSIVALNVKLSENRSEVNESNALTEPTESEENQEQPASAMLHQEKSSWGTNAYRFVKGVIYSQKAKQAIISS